MSLKVVVYDNTRVLSKIALFLRRFQLELCRLYVSLIHFQRS